MNRPDTGRIPMAERMRGPRPDTGSTRYGLGPAPIAATMFITALFIVVIAALQPNEAKSEPKALKWCLSQPEITVAIESAIERGYFTYNGTTYSITETN